MRGHSLRRRLVVAAALAVLLALTLAALVLEATFARHAERRAIAELRTHLEQIAVVLDVDAAGALVLSRQPADPRFQRPLGGLYWQVDDGVDAVRLRSRSLWDQLLRVPADTPADGELHVHRVIGPTDTPLLVVERSLILPERFGHQRVRIAVALERAELDAAARAFTRNLAPYLALLGLVLIVAAVAAGRIGLAPLRVVRARLEAVRAGVEPRLGKGLPDEVAPLAAEVDALLDARDREIAKARERAADLAHGLKTPLQVLSGVAERVRHRDFATADEIDLVVRSLDRQVQRELVRARRAAGGPHSRARLATVTAQVVAVVQRTPDGRARDWHVAVPNDLVAAIDSGDLAEALGNLIENAARHARTRVALTAAAEHAEVVLRVSDDGCGIPPGQLDEVRRRGVRLAALGRGAGLGLAIVEDVATAWGGRLTLLNADGLVAELRLPAVRESVAGKISP